MLNAEQQRQIAAYCDGQIVGEYCADIVVNESIIVELKAVRRLLREPAARLLTATTVEVALLLLQQSPSDPPLPAELEGWDPLHL